MKGKGYARNIEFKLIDEDPSTTLLAAGKGSVADGRSPYHNNNRSTSSSIASFVCLPFVFFIVVGLFVVASTRTSSISYTADPDSVSVDDTESVVAENDAESTNVRNKKYKAIADRQIGDGVVAAHNTKAERELVVSENRSAPSSDENGKKKENGRDDERVTKKANILNDTPATEGDGSDASSGKLDVTIPKVEAHHTAAVPTAAYFYDCQSYHQAPNNKNAPPSPVADVDSSLEWSLDKWRARYCKDLNTRIAALSTISATTPPSADGGGGEVSKKVDSRPTLLFVDAKEECGRYREFLLNVRESGYAGMLVMLIYYAEDAASRSCALLAEEFAPLTVHYTANIPRFETTAMAYHGIKSYFAEHPGTVARYPLGGLVRPEWVEWCSNPFEDLADIEFPATKIMASSSALAGGEQSLMAKLVPNTTTYAHWYKRHNYFEPSDRLLIGTMAGVEEIANFLIQNMSMAHAQMLKSHETGVFIMTMSQPHNVRPLSSLNSEYSAAYGGFRERPCRNITRCRPTRTTEDGLPPTAPMRSVMFHSFCYTEGSSSLRADFFQKHGPFADTNGRWEPNGSPFCYMAYRNAISEVPRLLPTHHAGENEEEDESAAHFGYYSNTTPNLRAIPMKGMTHQHMIDAAERIRKSTLVVVTDQQRAKEGGGSSSSSSSLFDPNHVTLGGNIYANPSPQEAQSMAVERREWGGYSDACPDGKLSVLSMLGLYAIKKVKPFLASFVHRASSSDVTSPSDPSGITATTAAPRCTRLVLMILWRGAVATAKGADHRQRSRGDKSPPYSPFDNELVQFAAKHSDLIEVMYFTEHDDDAVELKGLLGIMRSTNSTTAGGASSGDGSSSSSSAASPSSPTSPIVGADSIEAVPGQRPRFTVVAIRPFYRRREFVDQRFEVGREWLERNYKRYRYVSNIDSRDIVFLGDPLRQLVKILRENGPVEDNLGAGDSVQFGHKKRRTASKDGQQKENDENGEKFKPYLNQEFVASVTESYPIGSYSLVHDAISHFARLWLVPFGPKVYKHFGLQRFTNGEPIAVVNSGHVMGTSVALLHFYRFYVRMTIETKYDFKISDQGTFTFYFYGMAFPAGYPHRLLGIHSSRSGFANPPHFNRLTRRKRALTAADKAPGGATGFGTLPLPYEYAVKDCADNYIAVAHQADRDELVEALLQKSALGASGVVF